MISAVDPNETLEISAGYNEIGVSQSMIKSILNSRLSTRLALAASALLFTEVVSAEEAEKYLSVPGMWVQAILIGGVAMLAGRFRWWLGLPFMIFPAVIALSTFGLRLDPDVATVIVSEQGESYFQYFYASALLAALMIGAGIWMGRRRSRRSE